MLDVLAMIDPLDKPTILIVDDEVSNIEIMNEALGDEYEICFATSGTQALEVAKLTLPDLVLLDVVMPGLQGFDVCRSLKHDPMLADIPVIFTTGLGDVEDEVRGLSMGAIDYVTKPIEPVVLRSRVRNHVQMKRMCDQLAQMAMTDALTGLHNRRNLDGLMKEAVNDLGDSGEWLSAIMIDIDFFKKFNDTYGHQSGDDCIRMVASALTRAMVSTTGFSARYGGEEFTCVLPRVEPEQALRVAEEIRQQVHTLHIPHAGSSVSEDVTLSIGVASARCTAALRPEDWIGHADRQLYLAKTSGRDQIRTITFGAAA